MVTKTLRIGLVQVGLLSASTAHRYASVGALAKAHVLPSTLEALRRHGLIHVAGSKIDVQTFGYRVTAVGWDFIEQEILKGV